MKLGILTAFHGKKDIFELFCMSMKRIMSDFDVEVIAVGCDDSEEADIAIKKGLTVINHENKPVSKKFNAGLKAFSEKNVDGVLLLGSDDIPCNGFIQQVVDRLECGVDFFGVLDLYFFSLNWQRSFYNKYGHWAGYSKPSVIGAGRVMSKKLLEEAEWDLWIGARNSGMDAMMARDINRVTKKSDKNFKRLGWRLKDEDCMLVDIKSPGSMNGLSNSQMLTIEPRNPAELGRFLPKDEYEYIMDLQSKYHNIFRELNNVNPIDYYDIENYKP